MKEFSKIYMIASLFLCLINANTAKNQPTRFKFDKNSGNILARNVRGHFEILLEIAAFSTPKHDVTNVQRHNDVISTEDRLLTICLASKTSGDDWNMLVCQEAKLNKETLNSKSYEEVLLPIFEERKQSHVVVLKNKEISSANVAFSFQLSTKSQTLYLMSSLQQEREQAFATIHIQCSRNFYGPRCQSCSLPSPRHTCDHVTGQVMCLKEWMGRNCDIKIFISRQQASQFIRSKRDNRGLFEELLPGDIERECLEESCNREEAREAFEDDVLTDQFWNAYTDPDFCQSNPCVQRSTDHCEDLLGNYTCHCHPGYTGRNCEQEIGVCHSQPCKNGGTCESTGPASYVCRCPIGYRGRICSINIDDCVQSNCGLHGDCIDGVNSFSCDCDAGYTGLQCDVNIDDCARNPCKNGGNCSDHVNFYTCNCPNPYTGNNCQQEINPCRNNPCLHGGFCEVGSDLTYECLCLPEYTGKLCQHPVQSICASAPCKNEGTCYEIRNNVTDELNPRFPDVPREFGCACASGFTGRTCEEKVNPCYIDDNLCSYNSTCVPLDDEYICVCPEGFMGDMCQFPGTDSEALDRLRCTNNPCFHDAQCLFYQNKTTCICRSGFQGLRCEFEVDHCASQPCTNNGECIAVPTGFYCNCPQGFRGTYCEEDINECTLEDVICQNRATCLNLKGSFQCICGPYHTGRFCEHDFDPCELDPCLNGGTCDRETIGYICDCLQGFGGKNCNAIIDPCTEVTNPCNNGATCSSNPDVPYEAICLCTSNFYGRTCSKRIDNCAIKTNITSTVNGKVVHQLKEREDCGENGNCVSTTDGFNCNCHRGYEGERCDKAFTLPVVNCTTENCHCPISLVDEVRLKSDANLQCQYRHYTKGVCKTATCLTSVCPQHDDVYECVWVSECLTAYLAADPVKRRENSSFGCPVLEIVLNRNLLEDDTTVEHFCDRVRSLPSYQRFANVALVHCSLLQLNDDNCSLAVSVDSVTSQKQAVLLASDLFQTLEQELGKGDAGMDSNFDPTFSAMMEIRYASSDGHPHQTTSIIPNATSPIPQRVPSATLSTYYYAIIVLLILFIFGCAIAGYIFFYRKRRKDDLLVLYAANPNSSPTDESNSSSAPAATTSSVAKRKSKKGESASNGYVNHAFIAQQSCSALAARHSVESNPYVTMPYATMEASPRNSSASTETKKSVEESTLDYGVMTKIPDVHESNHYELMTSFPSFSEDSRSATLNNDDHEYMFALENQSPVGLKEKKNSSSQQSFNNPFTNDYEEIEVGQKTSTTNQYETVQPFSSSIYTNMQSSPTFKETIGGSINDTLYNFATEIPSMGVPSVFPSVRTPTTKKEKNPKKDFDVSLPRSSGDDRSQTIHTKSAPQTLPCFSSGEPVQELYSKSSKQSPVFLKRPSESSFFPNKSTELPSEIYSNPH